MRMTPTMLRAAAKPIAKMIGNRPSRIPYATKQTATLVSTIAQTRAFRRPIPFGSLMPALYPGGRGGGNGAFEDARCSWDNAPTRLGIG
jgi:hypothetical protein